MSYLLDTHVFLWLDGEPDRLSKRAAAILADESNSIFLSLASVWEIQIKSQLGKLKLNSALHDVITTNQQRNRIQVLPITLNHILELADLPDHHRDPFDRLLIAQAKIEKLTLLTNDTKLKLYLADAIW